MVWYAMVCYATKCYAMLWYAMLWYAMLCYAMLPQMRREERPTMERHLDEFNKLHSQLEKIQAITKAYEALMPTLYLTS